MLPLLNYTKELQSIHKINPSIFSENDKEAEICNVGKHRWIAIWVSENCLNELNCENEPHRSCTNEAR